MPLTSLNIRNFRNIGELAWQPGAGLNILEGENAQGKTNLLEAVYYLANGRSFRVQDPQNLIRFDAAGAELTGRWVEGDLATTVQMRILPEGRETFLQGKPLHRLGKIHEQFRALLFTPDSALLFRGSPTARRRYFDQAIGVVFPEYGPELARYQRILRQRNQCLEDGAPEDVLAGFDRQWADAALVLVAARRKYLRELTPFWERRFRQLSGMELELNTHWEESAGEEGTAALLEALGRRRSAERARRRTLAGPHLDDLKTLFSRHAVREVGSQGQQRMLVIALKLAEADLFRERGGRGLIFLLDDLGSELDAGRQRRLIDLLGELKAQTVLTTAQTGIYADLQGQTFQIAEGVLFTKPPSYVTS